tara:strand:- start:185 stop:430 length:246 start_codon:yes stop_codon:yes gene_type:complete
MPQNEIANLTFDIMDFIEDDPEALKAFESILDEAVEEWLEANGYEDWDVDDWDDIDTTITISGLRLSPEPDDDDIDEDEEV